MNQDDRTKWPVEAYGRVIRGDESTSEDQLAVAETDEIAQRMAVCWNACLGVSTIELQLGRSHEALLEAVQDLLSQIESVDGTSQIDTSMAEEVVRKFKAG